MSPSARLAGGCEQAIYSLLSGNASRLVTSDFIRTWQDAVWALASCGREARATRMLVEHTARQLSHTKYDRRGAHIHTYERFYAHAHVHAHAQQHA